MSDGSCIPEGSIWGSKISDGWGQHKEIKSRKDPICLGLLDWNQSLEDAVPPSPSRCEILKIRPEELSHATAAPGLVYLDK